MYLRHIPKSDTPPRPVPARGSAVSRRAPVLGFGSVSSGKDARRLTPADYGSQRVDAEGKRGGSSARGYNARWQKARATVLAREPLCRVSLVLEGRTVSADLVDHWYPHAGCSWLFWTTSLWVPMSAGVHNRWKQALEARGETALDDGAVKLGLSTLAALEPVRVADWRAAWAAGAGRSR